MQTFFTFLLLLSLLNDIFEFNCQGMMALTCSSRLAPESTELIFIKAVHSSEPVTWSISSFFFVTPSVKLVATALVLTASATLCLFFHLLRKPTQEKLFESSIEDAIEMIDISSINQKSKKPSCSCEPLAAKSEVACDSPYAVFVGDLFNEEHKISVISYAIYLGKLFSKAPELSEAATSPYEVYLGDLFNEVAQPQADSRLMSHMDATVYDNIEARKPRNEIIEYDLFAESAPNFELLPEFDEIESVPMVQNRRYSFASLKAQKAEKDLADIFASSMSIDDFASMIQEASISKSQQNMNILLSFSNLFTIIEEGSIAPSQDCINKKLLTVNDLYTSSRYNLKAFTYAKEPVSISSYEDAVGYSPIEIKKPANTDDVGYEVYLGDLFNESELKIPDNSCFIPPDPSKKISYADAVGYDHMEVKYPRKSPLVHYDVYLGDLFAEPEIQIYNQDIELDFILKVIQLIELNIKYYITYALTKSILNNPYYKPSPRNKQPLTKFMNTKHYNTMKYTYIY